MFRAKVSVEVWLEGDEERKSQVVEVLLEDPFPLQKLGPAESALQRGVSEGLKAAIEELMMKTVKRAGKPVDWK